MIVQVIIVLQPGYLFDLEICVYFPVEGGCLHVDTCVTSSWLCPLEMEIDAILYITWCLYLCVCGGGRVNVQWFCMCSRV